VALNESAPLLRFAAEKINNLDPLLSLSIANARFAADGNEWSPEISQEFWSAFAKLCDLIQPVTLDSLSAARPDMERRGWFPWRSPHKVSLAERSSGRYLGLLFALIAVIVPLQLYVWMCSNLGTQISAIYGTNQTLISQNTEAFQKLAATSSDPGHNYSPDELRVIDHLGDARSAIISNLARAQSETRLLELVATLHSNIASGSAVATAALGNWFSDYNGAVNQQNMQEAAFLAVQEQISLILGVLQSFVMPLLFGMIGAVAFVIRTISDQIQTSTFSHNTPIRHLLRVGLGVLAGVVVGLFNGLSAQLSLPPLAIAFLAGYGVDALFSMFDGIIAKFRA
jgi:hypothetical protein